ncbi:MAG: SCP2 sterol-binding domain-containing protein [Promethearchaeota archaeon]
MSSSNYKKTSIHALNAHLITVLLYLFITGILLVLMGLFLSLQDFTAFSGLYISQSFAILVFIIGLILIGLGALESIGIIKKTKNIMDNVLEKGEITQYSGQVKAQSPGIGGTLRIIRPTMSTSTFEPIKPISTGSKPKQKTQTIGSKQPAIALKKVETPKNDALNINLEEGLKMIIDRYNDPKVSKAFSNWQNTLMMTFPDLNKSYLFIINDDQGIQLEEGHDEEAAVQVSLDSEVFLKMMTKQVNPIKLYSSGGLEVKGKMRNLLKLRKLMF